MAKFKLDFGAELEVLTKNELDDSLKKFEGVWRSYAGGFKRFRLPVLRGAVSGGSITLGSTSVPGQGVWCGPRQGFVWRVTRVSVAGMATGDAVTLYNGDPSDDHFVTSIPATSPAFLPGHGLILLPGDHIVTTGSALTGTQITLSGEAIEAPAEQVYKVLGG